MATATTKSTKGILYAYGCWGMVALVSICNLTCTVLSFLVFFSCCKTIGSSVILHSSCHDIK